MDNNITIIDYGLGNLASIKNMIKKIGGTSSVTADKDEILAAKKLILPGVGSFEQGMKNLIARGLTDVLSTKVVNQKTPILGICLGMQLMTNRSEEGNVNGLGWINADTVKFNQSKLPSSLKIPHMGWTDVNIKSNDDLFVGEKSDLRYYFVHSYHVVCKHEKNIMATSDYGYQFTCGIVNDNVIGVQFHPEKSHKYGIQLLTNFLKSY
jgi:imidazole glycerol-phosphate synthase subunit HisH